MFKSRRNLWWLMMVGVLVLAVPTALLAGPGQTERVSVATDGTPGNEDSEKPDISGDGRYIAFHSDASNLVPNDTNDASDVFVRDTVSGETTRVSVSSDGEEGNTHSELPAISDDGRYVAFLSVADNLVPGDTNLMGDVFVHDIQTGETTRVSVASDGSESDVLSYSVALSGDGRYVVFASSATNLVSEDTDLTSDVFVHDRQTGETTCVSVATDGTKGNLASSWPAISPDGNYVAFQSYASNLVSGDTNGKSDIFVHNVRTGKTLRVSSAADGTEGNGDAFFATISLDGRYVAFRSAASNLVPGDTNGVADVFMRDTQTDELTLISQGLGGTPANGQSNFVDLSADGRYAAFQSVASNLISNDTNAVDIFMHDTETGEIKRVSVASDGTEANDSAGALAIAADGGFVAFNSSATNLVSGDTNVSSDIFRHQTDLGNLDSLRIIAVSRVGAGPMEQGPLDWNVTFSEAVTGVDAGDFVLTTEGSLSDASVAGVSGSGAVYTVTVSTGAGGGTVRLAISHTATITSLDGAPLSGLPYSRGAAHTVLTKVFLPLVVRN